MLSIGESNDRITRRAMMTIGGLGFGGLTLANLLAAKSQAAASSGSLTTGKSVIFLLQHGGPTQFETFDPKLDVPDAIRTVGGVTQTSVPGTIFGSAMPGLARHADKLAVVRSYSTGSGAHSNRPLITKASVDANIGSLYARFAGSNDVESGLPTNVALYPNSIDPTALGPDERFGKLATTGDLGSAYTPFAPGGGSDLQRNMTLALPRNRFHDRRALLSSLDRLRRKLDASGTMEGVDKFRQQALDMVLRGVGSAFDLSQEDPKTIARYDTGQYVDETGYADKSNGAKSRRWYQTNAQTLGKQLLLARRLCESGCGFVTNATRFVWDMHADTNNIGVERGMDAVIRPFDHAITAFIEDCEERGIADDILLVTVGEMGRTPKINKRGGRDHWGRLAPLMMYGGGISRGQVIGQSTVDGGAPQAGAVGTEHLVSTILHTLLDIGELRLRTKFPNDLMQLASSGTPIPGLF